MYYQIFYIIYRLLYVFFIRKNFNFIKIVRDAKQV